MKTPEVHVYNHWKHIWLQKSYDAEPKVEQKAEREDFALSYLYRCGEGDFLPLLLVRFYQSPALL